MTKGFAPGSRIWILALCVLVGYGAISYRLVELHYLKRPQLVSEIQRSRFRIIETNPRRGEIVDARNELLATNQVFYEVGLDPALLEEEDLIKIPELAEALDLSAKAIEGHFGLKNGRLPPIEQVTERWRLLRRGVDERTYAKVDALKIKGVYGNSQYERVYPKNQLAAHIVGYLRRDGEAAIGAESSLDYYLSGQKGWKEVELRHGREMAQFRRRETPARDGMTVQLTIDSYAQTIVEQELKWIADTLKPEWASIIVSDPRTGSVLALGNYPTFDPNRYSESELSAQKNRALSDPYEPGSTFKIVAASAALEEGLVGIGSVFDCSQDTIRTPSGYIAKLPRDSHSNGVMTVEEIVAKSSNRGAAHLGVLLGSNEFYGYVKRFGFGEVTDFSIGSESRGILQPPARWDGLTITRMPMGHAIGATAIQVHSAMSSIANDGILMKPRVVARIIDTDGQVFVESGPVPVRRVISEQTAQTMSNLLEKTVSPEGTANIAAIAGYRVAGKTGTSQKIVNNRYSNREHVGSFSGFFPANDPRLVITVVVDGAKTPGVAYGGTVAAPSFKRIASKFIPYYAIEKPEPLPAFAASAIVNKVRKTN